MADFAAHRAKMRVAIADRLGEPVGLPSLGASLIVPVQQVPVESAEGQLMYMAWVARVPEVDIAGLQPGDPVDYDGQGWTVAKVPPPERGQVLLEFY